MTWAEALVKSIWGLTLNKSVNVVDKNGDSHWVSVNVEMSPELQSGSSHYTPFSQLAEPYRVA